MEAPISLIKEEEGTGDNEVPPSVQKVVSNEDLLIEILVRLPIISLHLFRFVSKWWLSLITSPKFVTRRSQITNLDPTSGLFLRDRSSDQHVFLPLDNRIPANSYPLPLAGKSLKLLDSCNGLLLFYFGWRSEVYVYNPSINNMFKKLPEDKHLYFSICEALEGGFKLAFDPTKSPDYKVVNAQFYNANCDMIEIQVYSSKTSTWTLFDNIVNRPEDFEFFPEGVYWNDAIHWLSYPKRHIVYHELDVEHKENKYTYETLNGTGDSDYTQLFESRGCLLLVSMVETPALTMYVYEMSNDDSWFSMKHCVTLDECWRSTPSHGAEWDPFRVLSIILGEREEDSFLVMFLDGKVLRYNFMSRNVSTLINDRSSGPPASFEFITSFARVLQVVNIREDEVENIREDEVEESREIEFLSSCWLDFI